MHPKLIIFDLNKTLINENTWLNLNIAMGVTQLEDSTLVSWAEQGIITDKIGQNILCEIYKQRGDVSRHNIKSILNNYTYKEGARKTVQTLIDRGYQVALISGAMDILVSNVASELGIHYWRASNTFIFDKNNNLVRIKAPQYDATDKANQALEICKQLGIQIRDCVAIGDGENDVELFKLSGKGITFTNSKIASEAKHVINNLTELLTIIK